MGSEAASAQLVRYRASATISIGRLVLFVFLGGVASMLSGKDVNWDLRNYHFYNPWAALNGRLGWDIAPAQIQTFLNPVADFPFYFLVTVPLPDYVVSFFMGLPFGVAALFLWQIVRRVREEVDPRREIRGVGPACVALGLTGAAGLPQIGSTTNEWHVAALLLGAVYFLIESIRETRPESGRRFILAGVFAGAACGAKLTAVPYAVALFLVLVVLAVLQRVKWRAIVQFCLAATAGFAALMGPWMWVLHQHYGSPMFPFFNGYFQAPLFPAENWRDATYLPRSWSDALLFPLRLAQHSTVSHEHALRDARLLAFLGILGYFLLRRLTHVYRDRGASEIDMPITLFLGGLGLISLLIWEGGFAIYRYAIVLELVVSVVIAAGLVLAIRNRKTAQVAMWVAVICLIGFTKYPLPARIEYTGQRYFDDAVPALPGGSLVVILVHGDPVAHLLPGFGLDVRFVRPAGNFIDLSSGSGRRDNPAALAAIRKVVLDHPGPVYVMRYEGPPNRGESQLMGQYQREIRMDRCEPVRTRFFTGLTVCETAPVQA